MCTYAQMGVCVLVFFLFFVFFCVLVSMSDAYLYTIVCKCVFLCVCRYVLRRYSVPACVFHYVNF